MFTKKTREAAGNIVVSLRPIGSFERAVSEMANEVVLDEGDFYERDFYCFSNFSSFKLQWKNVTFDTVEHAYHWEKFNRDDDRCVGIQRHLVFMTESAHEAFELAQREREHRRRDWDHPTAPSGRPVKVVIMKQLLAAKLLQHPYVQKKARQVLERDVTLTERSWRDRFWGTGPEEDGEDWMGRLWMEVIKEWDSHE